MQSQIAYRRACVTGVRTCQSSFDRNRPQQEGREMLPVTFVSGLVRRGLLGARALGWMRRLAATVSAGRASSANTLIGLLHRRAFAHFGGYVGVNPTIEGPGGPRWRRSSTWSADAVDAVLAS